jgi:hypothetical protein
MRQIEQYAKERRERAKLRVVEDLSRSLLGWTEEKQQTLVHRLLVEDAHFWEENIPRWIDDDTQYLSEIPSLLERYGGSRQQLDGHRHDQ